MATSLGELFLELGLDTETFDRQLDDVKSNIQGYAKKLEAQLKLSPTVDHSELIELNKHFDKKLDHAKLLQSWFNRNPLKPKTDGSGLVALSEEIDTTHERYSNLQQLIVRKQLKPNVDIRPIEELRGSVLSLQSDIGSLKNDLANPVKISVDRTEIDQARADLESLKEETQSFKQSSRTTVQGGTTSVGGGKTTIKVEPQSQGLFGRAGDVAIGRVLERAITPVVDLALEEGFVKVLSATSSVLKQTLGKIEFMGLGKYLSQEITRLEKAVQKIYAPKGGVTGRVETARQQVEKPIREVVQAPLKAIASPILKAFEGLYFGIGSTYGEKLATGAIRNFEKRSGRNLEEIGEKMGGFGGSLPINLLNSMANRAGQMGQIRQNVAPVLSKYGIDIGKTGEDVTTDMLDAIIAATDRVGSILDKSLDESQIEQDLQTLKESFFGLGKSIGDVNKRAEAFQRFDKSLSQVMNYPRQAVVGRYKQSARSSAQDMAARIESPQTPMESLDPNIKRVAFVSAGFSATGGKQSLRMADQIAPLMNPSTKVVPFENRDFEVQTDAAKDIAGWIGDVLDQVSGVVDKGYNPAAVRMAAEAYQYKQQNPDLGIDLIGHSAGGLIATEAQEILKQLGVEANVLSMGSPNVGAFKSKADRRIGLMGQGDVLRHAGDASAPVIPGVGGHELPFYLGDENVQNIIKQFSAEGATPELIQAIEELTTVVEQQTTQRKQEVKRSPIPESTQKAAKEAFEQAKAMAAEVDLNEVRRQVQHQIQQRIPKQSTTATATSEPETPAIDPSILKDELMGLTRKDLGDIAKSMDLTGVSKLNKSDISDRIIESGEADYIQQIVKERNVLKKFLEEEKAIGKKIAEANALVGKDAEGRAKVIAEIRQDAIRMMAEVEKTKATFKNSKTRQEMGGLIGRTQTRLNTNLGISPEQLEEARKQLMEQSQSVGENVSEGLANGIDDTSSIKEAAKQMAKTLIDVVESELGIQSPSKVFERIGRFVVEGFYKGLSDVNPKAPDLVKNFVKNAEQRGRDVVAEMQSNVKQQAVNKVNQTVSSGRQSANEAFQSIVDVAKEALTDTEGLIDKFGGVLTNALEHQFGSAGRVAGEKFTGILQSIFGNSKNIVAKLAGLFIGFKATQLLVTQFARLIPVSMQVAREFERIDISFKFLFGSFERGREQIEATRESARRLGIDFRIALQGQERLAAATRGSVLEGNATEQGNQAIQQAIAASGLGPEQADRAYMAISQTLAKGKLSAEEIRGQLSEVGGIFANSQQILARALGVSTSELDKMMARGELLADEVMPKFFAQLKAETLYAMADAADTTQASMNRLNNSMTDLQVSIGGALQPLEKLGIQALTGIVDGLTKSIGTLAQLLGSALLATLVGVISKIGLAKVGGLVLTGVMKLLSSAAIGLGKVLMSPVASLTGLTGGIFAVIEVSKIFTAAFADAGGEVRDFADRSSKALQDYKNDLDDAVKAQSSLGEISKNASLSAFMSPIGAEITNLTFDKVKEIIVNAANVSMGGEYGDTGKSLLEDTLIGSILGKDLTRGLERGVQNTFGLRRFGEKQAEDIFIAENDAVLAAEQATSELLSKMPVMGAAPTGEIARLQDIDKQLQDVQTQRRLLLPGDEGRRRELKRTEQGLTQERDKILEGLAPLTGIVSANIEDLTKLRDKALEDRNFDKAQEFDEALQNAQSALDQFNSYVQVSVDVMGRLNRSFADVQSAMERNARQIDAANNQNRRSVAQGTIAGASIGTTEFGQFQNEQDTLQAKALNARQAAQQIENLVMNNVEAMDVLKQMGIEQFSQIDPAQLRARAVDMDDSKQRNLIEMAADRAEQAFGLQAEADNLATQAVEGRAQFVQSIRNLAKQINDFFVNVANQAKEAQIQAQAIAVQTNTQRAQSKLRQSLIGFQDSFINEFADALVQLVEQLNKPLQDAIGAQSQILQVQQQYFSQLQQAFQMGQQLPGLGQVAGTFGPLPGETMQGVPMPAMDNPYGESGVQRPNGEMMGTPATLSTPGASLNPMNPAVNPQAFMQGLQGLEQVNPLQATAFGMGGLQNAGQLITQNYEQQIANIQQQLINSQELAAIEAEVTADRANRALFDATRRINDTARQYNRSIEDLLTSGMDKTAFGQLGNGLRQLDRSLEDSIIGMTDFRRQLTATVEQSAMLYQQITEGIASGLLPDTFRDFLPGLERMAADAQSQLANVDRQITQFQEAAQESRRRQIEGFVRDQRKELQTALAENARLSGRGDDARLIEYGQRIEQQKEELRLQRIELENLRSSGQITNDEFVMMAQNMEDLNAIKMDNIRRELKRTQRDVEFSSRRLQQQLSIDITRASQRSAELAGDMSSKVFLDAQAQAQELGEAYVTRMNDLRSQLESGAIDSSQFESMTEALQMLNDISLENLKRQFEQLQSTEFFKVLSQEIKKDPEALQQGMEASMQNLTNLQMGGIISSGQRRAAMGTLNDARNVLSSRSEAGILEELNRRRDDTQFMSAIESLGGGRFIELMNAAESMFTPTNRAIDQGFESGQREADAIRNSATFDSVPDNVARIAMKMDKLIAAVQSIASPDSQLSQSKPAQSPMLSSTADLELAIANL